MGLFEVFGYAAEQITGFNEFGNAPELIGLICSEIGHCNSNFWIVAKILTGLSSKQISESDVLLIEQFQRAFGRYVRLAASFGMLIMNKGSSVYVRMIVGIFCRSRNRRQQAAWSCTAIP
jgi:hypothetical protein